MEGYDPEVAAKVWNRVRAGSGQDDLAALIGRVQMDGAVYAGLSRQLGGQLRKLAEAKQAHAACLRGIYIMTAGQKPTIPEPRLPKASPLSALRRCLAGELHTLAQYEQRTADGQFGPIFVRLVREQQLYCRMVAELIGKLGG